MRASCNVGQLVLDSAGRSLYRADSRVSLTPKAFDVRLFLAQNPNRLVTKDELLQAVWGNTFVEEGICRNTSGICARRPRRQLRGSRFIVTIARKGYQFTGGVTVAEVADIAKQAAVTTAAAYRLRCLRNG